ncbi:hypothetical protein [Candidatus Accumulibacter sp. ACC007]|nr:hypothetical protein [Candidatus Accumulibacter sp. ACC007]
MPWLDFVGPIEDLPGMKLLDAAASSQRMELDCRVGWASSQ